MWPRQRSLSGHCLDIYHAFARYLTYSGALPAPPPSQSLLSHTNSDDCELQNDAHCQENGEQIFLSLIFILFESFCKTWLIPLKLPVKIKTYNSCYRASQYGVPFVNLLFISLLVVFFVICSFIYDNFITDCPFSQRSNFTIIGYLIKPFLYLLVI